MGCPLSSTICSSWVRITMPLINSKSPSKPEILLSLLLSAAHGVAVGTLLHNESYCLQLPSDMIHMARQLLSLKAFVKHDFAVSRGGRA
jgi:hypothetical protein